MEGGWHRGERRLPGAAGDAGAPTAQPRPPPPRPWAHRWKKREEPRPSPCQSRAACRPPLTAQSPRGLQTWLPLLPRSAPTRPGLPLGPEALPAGLPSRSYKTFREDRDTDRPACHPCRGPLGTYDIPSPKSAPWQETPLPQWAPPAHAHYRPSPPHLMCPNWCLPGPPDRGVHPILTSEELWEKTVHTAHASENGFVMNM